MTRTDEMLTEKELDALLELASEPQVPLDFEKSLARRLVAERANNIVPFPQRIKPPPRYAWRWQMPAALAASLVLGIWFGTQGSVDNALADATETAMLGSANDFGPAGLEELDNFDLGDAT